MEDDGWKLLYRDTKGNASAAEWEAEERHGRDLELQQDTLFEVNLFLLLCRHQLCVKPTK